MVRRGGLEVVCLGILVADMVARPVDELPPPGELRLVGEMGLYVGGCAASTAIGLARLGVATGVLGKVGADALGDFLCRSLAAEGLDIGGVRADPATATAATMALVGAGGERAFLHSLGGNGTLRAEEVDLEAGGAAPLLHVGGVGLMPTLDGAPLAGLCARARRLGVTVTLDTAWDPLGRWTQVRQVLAHVDYFLPSLEEAQRILGATEPAELAARARDLGARHVVVKMGGQGCYVLPAGQAQGVRLPPLPVRALDTTGAGDAFCAGFVAGLARGWGILDAARLGNVTGGLAVTRIGAVSGLRSWEQTLEIFKRGVL